jgi:pimeloyl-ACP methyl ester carboxylesterase
MAANAPQTGYAPVNGLDMYYEVHGDGPPLVLLHGAYMTVDLMAPLLDRADWLLAMIPPFLDAEAPEPTDAA